MAGRRVETKAGVGDSGAGQETPLRPGQCRAYMRRVLAREFRGIVQGFVQEAKSGSCQHVKLATELVTPPTRPKRRQKSTAQLLVERLEREEAEARAAGQAGQGEGAEGMVSG